MTLAQIPSLEDEKGESVENLVITTRERTVKREKEETLHLHFPPESFILIEKVKGGDL